MRHGPRRRDVNCTFHTVLRLVACVCLPSLVCLCVRLSVHRNLTSPLTAWGFVAAFREVAVGWFLRVAGEFETAAKETLRPRDRW